MEKYKIKTLEELNEIDEKIFSKLEYLSFELPNGEKVNSEAEHQAWKILEDRRAVYQICKINIKAAFDPVLIITPPTFFAYFIISIPIELSAMKKAKNKAYILFCELREKINGAYQTKVTYRSYPSLGTVFSIDDPRFM